MEDLLDPSYVVNGGRSMIFIQGPANCAPLVTAVSPNRYLHVVRRCLDPLGSPSQDLVT